MESTEKVIEVKNLNVRYNGFNAISDVSFDVDRGEIVIIIGPNGAGKTTLIKALINLIPYEGTVKLLGKTHGEMQPNTWQRIGYVPQRVDIPRNFPVTVKDLLKLSINLYPINVDEKKRRIVEFIKLEHLEKFENKLIGDLSGGEMQRVLIARALLSLPDLILFDEPLAGIDVSGERTFYEFVSYIRTEFKISSVIISHDVTAISRIADRVMGLNRKIYFFGKPEDVLSQDYLKSIYGENVGIFRHSHCPEKGPCDLYKEQEERDDS